MFPGGTIIRTGYINRGSGPFFPETFQSLETRNRSVDFKNGIVLTIESRVFMDVFRGVSTYRLPGPASVLSEVAAIGATFSSMMLILKTFF